MENKDGLEVPLSVTEKALIAQLSRIERRMERAARKMETEFGGGGRRAVQKFNREVQQGETALTKLGAAGAGASRALLGGLLGGGALVALQSFARQISGVVRGVAQVGDEARRAGIGVEAFQEWKYVAEQNRIGIDQMVDGFKELSLRAEEFATTGKGPGAEAFARLGYGADELKRKLAAPEELMLELIDRMQGFDRAAQLRLSDEIFGGTGGERFAELADRGSGALRDQIDRARELGIVMDADVIARAEELDRKWQELTTRVGTFGKELAVGFADGVASVMEQTSELEDFLSGETLRQSARDLTGTDAQTVPEQALAPLSELRRLQPELAAQAAQLANQLILVVEQLDAVGDVEAADALDGVIDRLQGLAEQANAGSIEAVDLREKLGDAAAEAESTLGAISSLDSVTLDGLRTQIGGVIGFLRRAVGAADALRAALPGVSDVDPAFQVGPSARRGTRAGTPGLAPTTSVRPQLPSIDSDFGTSASRDGGGGRGGGGARASAYDQGVEALRARVEALTLESVALARLAGEQVNLAEATERARIEADLLSRAQKDGRQVTPELRAEVAALADDMVRAGDNTERLVEQLRRIEDETRAGQAAFADLSRGIVGEADSAREAVGRLLARIAEVQLMNAVTSASSGWGSGIAGFLGRILTPMQGVRSAAARGDAAPAALVRVELSEDLSAKVDARAGRIAVQAVETSRPGILRDAVGAAQKSYRSTGNNWSANG